MRSEAQRCRRYIRSVAGARPGSRKAGAVTPAVMRKERQLLLGLGRFLGTLYSLFKFLGFGDLRLTLFTPSDTLFSPSSH